MEALHTVSLFVTQGSYEIELHCSCGEVTSVPEDSSAEMLVLSCPKNEKINEAIADFHRKVQ